LAQSSWDLEENWNKVYGDLEDKTHGSVTIRLGRKEEVMREAT